MPAPLLMLSASLLFATMGVCVKLASVLYTAGELVFYRSLVGALLIAGTVAWRGGSLRTHLPWQHLGRSTSGTLSLGLWFWCIGGLPLATAMTLNYMSSVWMAVLMLAGSVGLRQRRPDLPVAGWIALGFVGVGLVLQPTFAHDQWLHGAAGLLSGVLAALAYLQVADLGRRGEPGYRVVFYFAVGGLVLGAATLPFTGTSAHGAQGVALLLAIGVLATGAQMLMTRAYAEGRALSNAGLHYMGLVFSYAYGMLLFGDSLSLASVSGMVAIVAAGIGATLQQPRDAPAGFRQTRPPAV
ncbi:MAG TPA: DMT family transporter [Rubrivivax sp.]|jgi:drug/metabolite transporter (DMT)-like permease|nr:DMT family transporter [Rubrivivax sp.]